jgi:hypothetical protein
MFGQAGCIRYIRHFDQSVTAIADARLLASGSGLPVQLGVEVAVDFCEAEW